MTGRTRARRAAASGFGIPPNKRISVNLTPADLPKGSSRFDLPVAPGIPAADGRLNAARLAASEYAGELGLAGDL